MPQRSDDIVCWNDVAARAGRYYLPPTLTEYKCKEYLRLLDGWGIGPCRRALITDLYESFFSQTGLCQALSLRSEEVIGLDISRAICIGAKRAASATGLDIKEVSGDAREIPLANDSVDLILSPSTFDHFPEIETALAECWRVLRPGGRLVLVLNSADNPFYKFGVRLAEHFKRREYPTDHFYTRRKVIRLLTEAGFRPGRALAIMNVPLGLTTIAEFISGLGTPLGALANRLLVGFCRCLGRAGSQAASLTGWWVAVEGVKGINKPDRAIHEV
jgi:SAM-dependent methyltransferase